MKNIVLFVIGIIVTTSCAKHPKNINDVVINPIDKIELIENITEIKTDVLFREPVLYNSDSILIVLDRYNSDKCIHFFNINNNKYITSTAVRGQGPGEIVSPGTITFKSGTSNSFWLSDFGKQKIFEFYLDSILKNSDYKPSSYVDIPPGQFFLNYSFLNDSVIVSNILKFSSNLPNESQQLELKGINLLNQKYINLNYKVPKEIITKDYFSGYFNFCKSDSIIALAYNFSDLIIIQTIDGQIIKRVIGPLGFVKFEERRKLITQQATYSDIIENNGYLFCLYSGENIKGKNQRVPYNTEIRVFSIKGEYIKTFKFKEDIGNICIDSINKRIFSYSVANDKLFFFNYKI